MKSLIHIIIRIASGELSKELAFREFRNAEGIGQPPRFFIGDYVFARSPKNEESAEHFQLQTTIEAESLQDREVAVMHEQINQWLAVNVPKYKWTGDVLADVPHWEELSAFNRG
jgi:hypothetical protein